MGTPTIRIAAPYWLPETVRRGTRRVEKLGYAANRDQLDSRPRADPFEPATTTNKERVASPTRAPLAHIHTHTRAHTYTYVRAHTSVLKPELERRKRETRPAESRPLYFFAPERHQSINLSSPRGSSQRSFVRSIDRSSPWRILGDDPLLRKVRSE